MGRGAGDPDVAGDAVEEIPLIARRGPGALVRDYQNMGFENDAGQHDEQRNEL